MHPGPYRILVGGLNPWNGRPKVVPWPILFERVVPKRPVNHHYFWVCRNSDGWSWFYGWSALDQPCRESDQPCFMVDRRFGGMVDRGPDYASPLWDSVWCSPAGGFFFFLKEMSLLVKNIILNGFPMICHQNGSNWLSTQGTMNNRHPGPYRILVGTLNPWNDRPMGVGWDGWRDPDKASKSDQPWFMVDRPFEHLDQPSLISESDLLLT